VSQSHAKPAPGRRRRTSLPRARRARLPSARHGPCARAALTQPQPRGARAPRSGAAIPAIGGAARHCAGNRSTKWHAPFAIRGRSTTSSSTTGMSSHGTKPLACLAGTQRCPGGRIARRPQRAQDAAASVARRARNGISGSSPGPPDGRSADYRECSARFAIFAWSRMKTRRASAACTQSGVALIVALGGMRWRSAPLTCGGHLFSFDTSCENWGGRTSAAIRSSLVVVARVGARPALP